MPVIDCYLPASSPALRDRDRLAHGLTEALMQCEHTAGNPRAEKLIWTYLHVMPEESLFIAGQRASRAIYRVEVAVLEGAMDRATRQKVVETMTAAILDCEGSDNNALNAARVWVIFRDVPEGYWGGAGRLYDLQDLMRFIHGGGE